MAMTAVTPLVPYALSGGVTQNISVATIYSYDYNKVAGYEVYSYEFCFQPSTMIDEIGTCTLIKGTGYLVAGNMSWDTSAVPPHVKKIDIRYEDDLGEIIQGLNHTTEYSLSSTGSITWQNTKVNGKTVHVYPYCNFTIRVPHYNDGIPRINGNRNIDFSLDYAPDRGVTTTARMQFAMTYGHGFNTMPCMARITACGSFYNQKSLDEGTATSFQLGVYKTTDIYDEIYDADFNIITATQYLGLSTNGIDADVIPFTKVECEASYVPLTVTTEIQNWLLQWCNDAKSKPIYYVLKTEYYGYTRYAVVARSFLVGNAEPTLNFKYEDYYRVTTALTGDNQAWVKNASKLEYTFVTSAQKYAHIVSRYVKCGTYQSDGMGSCDIIEPDGDYIEVGCTDSRGFTTSKIITPTKVYDYFKPTAVIHCSNMTGDGDVKLSFSGRFKAVSFATGLNPLTLQFRYKKTTDADYGDWITIEEMTNQKVGSNGEYACNVVLSDLDYQATYYYQARIIDAINTIVSAEIAGVSVPVFDWSETDFNFNVPVTIKGEAAERIHTKGTDGIWTYILWDSGLCECWGTYSGSANLSNSEGALYYSNDITINYPTGYPYFDNVLVSGGGAGASWVRTTDGSSNSKVTFKIVGAASGNVAVTTHIHAWGLWK